MSKLTRIHGNVYDLTDFKHPGGKEALRLAYGRDASEMFMAHHSLHNPWMILNGIGARQVDDDGSIPPSPDLFDWKEEDPFATELINRVRTYFESISNIHGRITAATKATREFWIEILVCYSVIFVLMGFWFAGYTASLFLLPIVMWIGGVKCFHDAAHFSLSPNPYVNSILARAAPFFSSAWDWYHQHTIGHHMYTNLSRQDPDIAHAPRIIRVHHSTRWRYLHTFQTHYWPLVWGVGVWLGLQILSPIRGMIRGTYNRVIPYATMTQSERRVYIVGRGASLLLAYGWPFLAYDFWTALVWSGVPAVIFSLLFMANTQINHLTPESINKHDRRWYRHQVLTSHNFGTHNPVYKHLSGGLNYQIEHHLFPGVCHCHYPALQPIVKELCEKYDIHYEESSGYIESWRKYVQNLRNYSHE